MAYAKTTTVAVSKSREEIERMLTRFGATKFVAGWESRGAAVLFEARGRHVRFVLPLPEAPSPTHGSSKETARYEQTCKSRWRSLCLCIKAKIEAIESEISDFESEFLAFIVLPGGETVGQTMAPLLVKAYESGVMPPLMLGTGS